jgi:hypothetical protein
MARDDGSEVRDALGKRVVTLGAVRSIATHMYRWRGLHANE